LIGENRPWSLDRSVRRSRLLIAWLYHESAVITTFIDHTPHEKLNSKILFYFRTLLQKILATGLALFSLLYSRVHKTSWPCNVEHGNDLVMVVYGIDIVW